MYYFYKKRITDAMSKGALKVIWFPFIALKWVAGKVYDAFFPIVEIEVDEYDEGCGYEYDTEYLMEEIIKLRREVQSLNDRVKFLTGRKACN